MHPEPLEPMGMLGLAAGGIVASAAIAALLGSGTYPLVLTAQDQKSIIPDAVIASLMAKKYSHDESRQGYRIYHADAADQCPDKLCHHEWQRL